METISNALFWISNGQLVPVGVLLLLVFLRAREYRRTAAATPIGRQLPSPPQHVQIVRTPG